MLTYFLLFPCLGEGERVGVKASRGMLEAVCGAEKHQKHRVSAIKDKKEWSCCEPEAEEVRWMQSSISGATCTKASRVVVFVGLNQGKSGCCSRQFRRCDVW